MSFIQLTLPCPANEAETLGAHLHALGALSLTYEDAADEAIFEPKPGETPLWHQAKVIALFPEDHDILAVFVDLATHYPEALDGQQLQRIEDEDWERKCLVDFKPIAITDTLWICPSWLEVPNPHATNIILDPGLAFGTGTHATTQLCLRYLAEHPPLGLKVLDIGCGSGILAITALKLGATFAYATDIHEQALLALAENAKANDIQTTQYQANLPDTLPTDIKLPLVLANILAAPLIANAPHFASYVAPGGYLVLSGILPEQAPDVITAYEPWIHFIEQTEQDGWIRLVFNRHLNQATAAQDE